MLASIDRPSCGLLDPWLYWESGSSGIVRRWWVTFSACSAALAIAKTGSAADLPAASVIPPPVALAPDWSGFYLGVAGGGGFGSSLKKAFSNGNQTPDFKVDGAFGGGTVGYDKQWGNIVAGLEGDFSWSDVHGSANCPPTQHGWRP